MKLIELLTRKKQQEKQVQENNSQNFLTFSNIEINAILEDKIKNFFPETGIWYSYCFDRPEEVAFMNMPCHLRDNEWLSKLLCENLKQNGTIIEQSKIKNFIDNSETFANLRHDYELKIVKWQIKWIMNGGESWIIPDDYDEFDFLFGEDVDKIVRGGVVQTLSAIGINKEVIEEGIEKYAEIWRPISMAKGFRHLFQPIQVNGEISYIVPSEDHKKNWIANREYNYYLNHKDSVDKYGMKTPAMEMTSEEHLKLVAILEEQNEKIRNNIKNNSFGNALLTKLAGRELSINNSLEQQAETSGSSKSTGSDTRHKHNLISQMTDESHSPVKARNKSQYVEDFERTL